MNVTLYNNWYVKTDGRIGPWTITASQPATSEQIHNAHQVRSALSADGWTLNAIAATIGNMQHESSLDPALIEETNRWRLPNSAANLSDVPNSVMQNHYKEYYTGESGSGGYGIGLVQWDGKGITRQKLVGYCEDNNYIWYDGYAQMQRIFYEKENNLQWQSDYMWGQDWYWSNYVISTETPEKLADVWCQCYEISGGFEEREANARFWYDYFINHPYATPPIYILTANQQKTIGRSSKRMIYYT